MDTKPISDTVPKRILNNLLSSLEAGVVPRSGAPYIAIGRTEEIASLLDNLDSVAEGSAATRLIIGRYGSGKSFLMQLVRGFSDGGRRPFSREETRRCRWYRDLQGIDA